MDRTPHQVELTQRLRCAECGRESDVQARGWRALLGVDEPGDQPDVDTFCPECAAREFGGRPPAD